MPEDTEIECRDKGVFALLMITGARDGALASLRLKHVDLVEGSIFQDARDVRTKGSKTFKTYFLPVDPVYRTYFDGWVRLLREDLLFGHDDPLFPPPLMGHNGGRYAVTGLKREAYSNTGPIRDAIKFAFTNADLPAFAPHSFRKTLVRWADEFYPSRVSFKAFAENIGHSSLVTTVSAYMPLTEEQRGNLIKGISRLS